MTDLFTGLQPSLSRRRAPHSKSRNGCVTCKQRRIKCDQSVPICLRCKRANRRCQYGVVTKPRPYIRGFKIVTFGLGSLPSHTTIDSNFSLSIEYFCRRTLPILRQCQPSPLWDFLLRQLLESGLSVPDIAAAIGVQQRTIDQDCRSPDLNRQATVSYHKALRTLRCSVNERSNMRGCDGLILTCLLMVILESLRGSAGNMLVHIRCGISFLQERAASSRLEVLRDAERLFWQYAVDATIFNPLSTEAQELQAMVAKSSVGHFDVPVMDRYCDTAFEVSKLVTLLMQLITYYAAKRFPASTSADTGRVSSDTLGFTIWLAQIEKQRWKLEQIIDTHFLASKARANALEMALFGFAKARCIMLKVYVTSAWAGRQTSYDLDLRSFRQIVSLEAASLYQLSRVGTSSSIGNSDREPSGPPAAFAVGLGAQTTLTLVVHQCRDPGLRQQALELLDMCPRYEGLRELKVTKAICHAIIAFEEVGIGANEGTIPESRRVHHYSLVRQENGQDGWKAIELWHRPLSGDGFAVHTTRLVL